MGNELNEITDFEIRVIGSQPKNAAPVASENNSPKLQKATLAEPAPEPKKPEHKPPRAKWPWIIILFLLAGIFLWFSIRYFANKENEKEIFLPEESVFEPVEEIALPHPLQKWVESLDTLKIKGTAVKDTIINDIPLRIFVPRNATPRLEVGYDCLKEKDKNILFFQAADVRADNKKIVGAFVLRGEPLSRGLSKRGFCSIIDDQVTVGVADNSPLFEEATEKNGYFFRQYPLVDKGKIVENELKNKALRRSLCELYGQIVVVETQSPESMHDFSQALVDLDVHNAIYLVGSVYSIGWCKTLEGEEIPYGQWNKRREKNVSFIVWS